MMADEAQGPNKKRKLGDDTPSTEPAHPTRKHDASYYFCDGSCVILVEDTLFNVHASILARHQSFFQDMFAMPQPPVPDGRMREGSSDSNPLVLPLEHADAFRELLWALYAPPHELAEASRPGLANVTKLIDLAFVTNKYAYRILETWALDALAEHIKACFDATEAPVLEGSDAERISLITRLMRLAHRCNHRELILRATELLRLQWRISFSYAYHAMALADEYDLRSLRGEVYFAVLRRPFIVYNPSRSPDLQEGDIDSSGRLLISAAQQVRLLAGYYRLSQMSMRFLTLPSEFSQMACCQGACRPKWERIWEKAMGTLVKVDQANPIARLEQMWFACHAASCASVEFPNKLTHQCSVAGRERLAAMAQSIQDKLGDVFSDDFE